MCVCSDPRAGEKFLSIKIVPPAYPSVKRVHGLVLGCASLTTNGILVGLQVPTPAVGGTVSTPASSLPGLQEIASNQHIVPAYSAQVPWLARYMCDPYGS